jgi:hypothetical protein
VRRSHRKGVLRLGDHDRLAAVILPGQGTLFIITPLHAPSLVGRSRLRHWRQVSTPSCAAQPSMAPPCGPSCHLGAPDQLWCSAGAMSLASWRSRHRSSAPSAPAGGRCLLSGLGDDHPTTRPFRPPDCRVGPARWIPEPATGDAAACPRMPTLRPTMETEPTSFRLRDGCSASNQKAPDGSSLLRLDASSVQTAPDGYRRIVWMIIGMIKAHPTEIGWQGKQRPL